MPTPVYLETTIFSYLTAWRSNDLVRAAHQEVTRQFWDVRSNFELFTSLAVLEEIGRGDPVAAEARLEAATGIPVLGIPEAATDLAQHILVSNAMPQKAAVDALHVAIAATQGMEILLTWNCRHIANAVMRPKIEASCRRRGFEPPVICTPLELDLENHY